MSNVLKWEDPPPSNQGPRGKWGAVAAELKAHPGKWALIAEGIKHASTVSNGVKTGKIKAFEPAGEFEATTRSTTPKDGGPRVFDVYARYIGK